MNQASSSATQMIPIPAPAEFRSRNTPGSIDETPDGTSAITRAHSSSIPRLNESLEREDWYRAIHNV